MLRIFLLTLIVASVICVGASAREPLPVRAAQGPEAKKPHADNRGKIIDELRADYNDVVDEFARKNVNEEMRARQQRIIDNLKRLLEEEDPPRNPSGNASPPSPENSKADPPPSKPRTEKALPPQPKNAQGDLGEPKQRIRGKEGESETPPRSIEEMRNEKTKGNAWPPLPARQQDALDAHARDRFPPRYEELLRAYFRTIAESGRRDARE
jgi:hypothetical protein